MPRLAVLTPLPANMLPVGFQVAQDVTCVGPPGFSEDWQLWPYPRKSDAERLNSASSWLQLGVADETSWDDAATDLRHAMLGLQLWCPNGWCGVVVGTDLNTMEVSHVFVNQPYWKSRWSKHFNCPNSPGPNSFDGVHQLVEGVRRAARSNSAYVSNPFNFLEIGLQVAGFHPVAGSLLWLVGLDGLLLAQKKEVFARRLQRLLGANAYLLPPDRLGRQPSYRVSECAADLFEFRNQLAHGKPFRGIVLGKGRLRFELSDWNSSDSMFTDIETWPNIDRLVEKILFALLKGLRVFILDGHIDKLHGDWKSWLDAST